MGAVDKIGKLYVELDEVITEMENLKDESAKQSIWELKERHSISIL